MESINNQQEEQRTIFAYAEHVLAACSWQDKVASSKAAYAAWQQGIASCAEDKPTVAIIDQPGRPAKPLLVSPRLLPKRNMRDVKGRAAMTHAIAHIEFNAMDLAWDAVYRFRGLPQAYYADWVQVAYEETIHFSLLQDYLQQQGYDYGDFSAHNGLWEMAIATAYDVLARMALVPRIMEARALDVTPAIMQRYAQAGDGAMVAILQRIAKDEVGHVRVGNRWFRWICDERALDSFATFVALVEKHVQAQVRKPFLKQARLDAGFSEREANWLAALAEAQG